MYEVCRLMVTNQKQREKNPEQSEKDVSSKPIKVGLNIQRSLTKNLTYRPTLSGRAFIADNNFVFSKLHT